MRPSKKAQAAAGLIIAFGIITILIIAVYFFTLIEDNLAKKTFETTENQVDDEITLLNYLRTPVTNEENIADLISKYKMTNDNTIKTQIQTKSQEILNPLFAGTKNSWKIKMDNRELAQGKSCSESRTAKQEIIIYDGSTTTIELDICN